MQEDKGASSGLISLLQRVMRDLIGMIILAALAYNLMQCEPRNYRQEAKDFNGADTLRIMVVNDSITEIKTLK